MQLLRHRGTSGAGDVLEWHEPIIPMDNSCRWRCTVIFNHTPRCKFQVPLFQKCSLREVVWPSPRPFLGFVYIHFFVISRLGEQSFNCYTIWSVSSPPPLSNTKSQTRDFFYRARHGHPEENGWYKLMNSAAKIQAYGLTTSRFEIQSTTACVERRTDDDDNAMTCVSSA